MLDRYTVLLQSGVSRPITQAPFSFEWRRDAVTPAEDVRWAQDLEAHMRHLVNFAGDYQIDINSIQGSVLCQAVAYWDQSMAAGISGGQCHEHLVKHLNDLNRLRSRYAATFADPTLARETTS